eukprot:CAMPEP_0185746134 /NCGR_PEP_ID=MMETSP1174-20130828/4570_1 /TAXON_ID=35687 /ORGANISM="Dictyocha speculum, Strain CCMP1381" /LENGTH=693 /DNA_ID=CAMNT_0028420557 /DNA_START=187 /DNA_END=2269 /DNA_ORIENTATION=+
MDDYSESSYHSESDDSLSQAASLSSDSSSENEWNVRSTSRANLEANDIILRHLRSVTADLAEEGTLASRDALSKLATALCPPEIVESKLVSAVQRLTGLKRNVITDASSAVENAEGDSISPLLSQQRVKRVRKTTIRDEIFYDELIHASCPLVELNRTVKRQRAGTKRSIGRSSRQINSTCMAHTRHGTKGDIVDWVLQSEELASHLRHYPDCSQSRSLIRSCICDCIKEGVTGECVCPVCYDFEHRLKVFNAGIADVRKGVSCHCCGCKNESVFVQATQSPQLFRDAVCCKRIKFSGLELPHNPQFTPEFRPFKCVVDTDLPPHKNVVNCSRCGLNKIVPTSCAAMSTTSLSKTVHWNKRIPTAYQTTKGGWSTKMVLREQEGSLSDLWDEIVSTHQHYLYHTWMAQYTRWQFKLDIATFEPETSILVLVDFASQFEMHGEVKTTCEIGRKCNEYVCLVLHSASKTEADRGEREVVCDYIRIWSTASTSAEFHHQALRDIHERYIEILPNLSELHIWSDGHSSTYKGHPNFGRMATWPAEKGCVLLHNFFVEYHGAGPQDNAGKGPRVAMERAIGFGQANSLYNYYDASSGVEITSLVHVCSMIIKALGVATDFMSGGHIPWVRMIPTVKTPSRMWTCVLESTQEFVAPAACIVSELVLWKVPLSRAGLHLASVFRVGGPYLSVALIGTYGW